MVAGVGFRGFGFKDKGFGMRLPGFGFRFSSFEFREGGLPEKNMAFLSAHTLTNSASSACQHDTVQ